MDEMETVEFELDTDLSLEKLLDMGLIENSFDDDGNEVFAITKLGEQIVMEELRKRMN
jgi:predicted transcriptional regulator